jgi:hypothetical protein
LRCHKRLVHKVLQDRRLTINERKERQHPVFEKPTATKTSITRLLA